MDVRFWFVATRGGVRELANVSDSGNKTSKIMPDQILWHTQETHISPHK